MDVLLLSAGFGSRLGSLTRNLPKALVPVLGKPLIQYSLEAFASRPWVDQVVVVTGFEREQVIGFIEKIADPAKVAESFNPDYERGNIYSVAAGHRTLKKDRPFLVTNVDHIFPTDLLDHCFARTEGISAVCDRDRPLELDCMKIRARTDHPRQVQAIHKQLEQWDAGYIGMTFVPEPKRGEYDQALGEVVSRNEPQAYAEMVLARLAESSSGAPSLLDASGFGWLEVDTEADLKIAEDVLAQHPKFTAVGYGTAAGR